MRVRSELGRDELWDKYREIILTGGGVLGIIEDWIFSFLFRIEKAEKSGKNAGLEKKVPDTFNLGHLIFQKAWQNNFQYKR